MKKILFLLVSTLFIVHLNSCSEECVECEECENPKGKIEFVYSHWYDEFPEDLEKVKSIPNRGNILTAPLVDIKHLVYSIDVSKDDVSEDVLPTSIRWSNVYNSYQEMLLRERSYRADLDTGFYRSFRIKQRNMFYWGILINDSLTYVKTYNWRQYSDDDFDIGFSHIGTNGYHDIVGNKFENTVPYEKLGQFKIESAKTTKIRGRVNLYAVEWIDSDNSGTWTEGDSIVKILTPEGIITMTDFIVEN